MSTSTIEGGESPLSPLKMVVDFPVEKRQIEKNIEINSEKLFPFIKKANPHLGKAVIVGGGPSLANTFESIDDVLPDVWTSNHTYDHLIDKNLNVDYCVAVDPLSVGAVKRPRYFTSFLYATQVPPETFDPLELHCTHMWNNGFDPQTDKERFKKGPIIYGGCTVTLCSIVLAYFLGYRKIELHGVDSCYSGTKHHATDRQNSPEQEPINVYYCGVKFECAPWMAAQASDFMSLSMSMKDKMPDLELNVKGSGLIKLIHQSLSERQ